MKDLIEALTILSKYTDTRWPTICEHDILYIVPFENEVSDEDDNRLSELGFIWNGEQYISHRFGSA